MTKYRLHCFAQSGNSYKPALMLALAGADWEPVFVDYFDGASRSPEFKAINEMGEAPVLEHDGLVLSQSGAILDYLAEKLGKFGATDAAERREILRWILWDNHKFTSYNATWRFMINFVPEDKRSADVVGFMEAGGRAAMGVLEAHLAGRDWIVGNKMTIADLSCAGYMFYEHEFPFDWAREFPAITAWKERIRAMPRWKPPYDLMPGKN
ncbi:MAG TPA: glutathione S-transferase [Thermohalobaculum sp.]|nr:glutathione S-transferase [Thermohalobaculum sp.]